MADHDPTNLDESAAWLPRRRPSFDAFWARCKLIELLSSSATRSSSASCSPALQLQSAAEKALYVLTLVNKTAVALDPRLQGLMDLVSADYERLLGRHHSDVP